MIVDEPDIKDSTDMDIGLYELTPPEFNYLRRSRGIRHIIALDYHISKVKQKVKRG